MTQPPETTYTKCFRCGLDYDITDYQGKWPPPCPHCDGSKDFTQFDVDFGIIKAG